MLGLACAESVIRHALSPQSLKNIAFALFLYKFAHILKVKAILILPVNFEPGWTTLHLNEEIVVFYVSFSLLNYSGVPLLDVVGKLYYL